MLIYSEDILFIHQLFFRLFTDKINFQHIFKKSTKINEKKYKEIFVSNNFKIQIQINKKN